MMHVAGIIAASLLTHIAIPLRGPTHVQISVDFPDEPYYPTCALVCGDEAVSDASCDFDVDVKNVNACVLIIGSPVPGSAVYSGEIQLSKPL